MKVWATANQKGGVGKTTSAVTLAGVMQKRGQRVLLIDLDPHGSLTSYFGLDPDAVQASVYDLFQASFERIRPVIQKTKFNRLDFLPASSALATLDRQLGAKGGMGLIIKKSLHQVAGDYDLAIMDCPPMLGLLMVNALAACHRLLIPVQTEFLALKGLERMVHTLSMIQKAREQPVCFTIVPTFYDQRLNASIETLETLRKNYKETIWSGVIPVDTQFREASQRGIPLSIERISCKGARAYSHLLDYLLELDEGSVCVAGEVE
ncbi:ParA-like protein [hydrothermal vent metagenome]|uniref:ParA-like protein n=1 Tax=hydrothermal vent metagenome TaxID=652676 RepID=A0A3B0YRQ9_9ZZZZ